MYLSGLLLGVNEGEPVMRKPLRVLPALAVAAFFVLCMTARGKFVTVEVKKVPIERLVKNLERTISQAPDDLQALVNLARLHGMAYALKSETAELREDAKGEVLWFGHRPTLVPFASVTKTNDPAKQQAAKAHLVQAVERFRQAVELAPGYPAARLGYAWTLERSGVKAEAIRRYRALIEDAWKKERELTSRPMNGETVVTEAAGYLIPLLDREKDKDEIARLTERSARLHELPRPITPIALPLRSGLSARDIEDREAMVPFDADGSALKRKWTWITKDAGSLSEYDIVAVSCGFERDQSHPDRIPFSPKGVTFRDGTTRPTFDLILHPAKTSFYRTQPSP
jgi:hypothetical protein